MIDIFLSLLIIYLFVSLYLDYKEKTLRKEMEKLNQENQNKRLEAILKAYEKMIKGKE